jgi:hypothetical protein
MAFLVCLGSASASAEQPSAEEAEVPVGVIPLDDSARAGSLMQTVGGLLDEARFDVYIGDRLERSLAKRRVAPPDSRVSAKFAGLSATIASGVEHFFYKGNQSAIDALSPAFDLGMSHLDVLTRRPDYAAQVFEAGMVMIRAYDALDEDENARSVARALVESLPALEPSGANNPPEIISLVEAERQKLAEEGTILELEMLDGEECTGYVNGAPVDDEPVVVAADRSYMVTMDCGGSQAPVWRVEPRAGESLAVPISPGNPLEFSMQGDTFDQRRRAEAYLRMVAFWAGLPRMLGVSRVTEAESEESVLFVRAETDGEIVWSDGNNEEAITRGLARVLPSYRGQPAQQGDSSSDGLEEQVDWVGWSLVGGGAALVGVGAWVAVLAEGRAREIKCSPDTDYGTSAGECSDVDTLRFRDNAELETAESEVTRARIAGWGSLTAGVGLAAWGVWRLASAESPADQTVSVDGRPTAGGGMAIVRWRF